MSNTPKLTDALAGSDETNCSALLDKLIALRTLARDAQQLAIEGSEDGQLYNVIVALDPVVEGVHEALKIMGLGFMEYPPKPEPPPAPKKCPTCDGDRRGVWQGVGCTTLGRYVPCPTCHGNPLPNV